MQVISTNISYIGTLFNVWFIQIPVYSEFGLRQVSQYYLEDGKVCRGQTLYHLEDGKICRGQTLYYLEDGKICRGQTLYYLEDGKVCRGQTLLSRRW